MPMELENYAEPEVAVAAVVVAAVASPPVRRKLRQGLVYSLAAALVAGDRVAALATAVAGGAHRAVKAVKRGVSSSSTAPAAEAAAIST